MIENKQYVSPVPHTAAQTLQPSHSHQATLSPRCTGTSPCPLSQHSASICDEMLAQIFLRPPGGSSNPVFDLVQVRLNEDGAPLCLGLGILDI